MHKLYGILCLIASGSLLAQQPLDKQFYSDQGIEIKDDGYWQWIATLNNHASSTKPPKEHASTSDLPLFNAYPALRSVAHISLCKLPTPVSKLHACKEYKNKNIYIKRDDLSGCTDDNGTNAYGGNKPRKLEFELANALNHGADTVITFGADGSNHAVATGEYARMLGLKCICMLNPEPNSRVLQQNLLLHATNNVDLHSYPDDESRKLQTVALWADLKSRTGKYPYLIFPGASTPLGSVGFVNAGFELAKQVMEQKLPEPDYIYVACGSFGTTIGLALGCKAAQLKSKIVGVSVIPEKQPGMYTYYSKLFFNQLNDYLHHHDASFPVYDFDDINLTIYTDHAGTEYGLFTQEGQDALHMIEDQDGIKLDGCYTAKAFAAMINHIKNNNINGDNILFWNTYCGLDESDRIKGVDYQQLPTCFHHYFEEPVQQLDK
ncbi:hypothetical protein Noda2021_04210 [Candidatus Dependentiae bacterium Noda2021]|nr:hypothetical protein Noda2021_04210 [Candidatus Dependentiae bacterium Noda2021]